ncbi:MAG: glycoside hydrolase family 2 protein, partial [bacterium]|nr:glycoside hydrolase family 2 protein [bacterium]
EEIPGWQYIGNEVWKQVACENAREMIERDWNHPSIISWGVRINESADDRDFYSETNRIAHAIDATRQTCGIRCIPNSELLEDVYTMNDFSHSGGELVLLDQQKITGLDRLVPYMVTEFNGHMYPTKRFDQEERLIEHALRHARVQSRAGADEQICGAIGWCAFDYNTHQNFGSGDRICYHGVMDMFRLPKMAAQVYRSQVPPDKEHVLEPATLWARGERDIGGVIPMVIFTNCESVELFYGEKRMGSFTPDVSNYPGLEYPPIVISNEVDEWGYWGHGWEDGRFVGYVEGKAVIEKSFVNDPLPKRLQAVADDASLQADGIDVTRVVFRMEDRAGNLLPYLHDFLKLSVQGPGEIIGPHEVSLIGGTIAVWVKSQMTAGTIILSAASTRLKANDVTIETSM